MQVLRYSTVNNEPAASATDGLPEVSYRTFSEVEALDAYNLTVVDLQDSHLWQCNYDTTISIDEQNDLNSVASAIEHSSDCKVLILLPQNYTFRYDWSWQGGNDYDFDKSKPLKDIISLVTESVLGRLSSFPISLTYGKSKTMINGKCYTSDFSFNTNNMMFQNVIFESMANTITGIQLNDRLFATTLKVSTGADLMMLVSALNIFSPEVAELPKWLDEVSYLNETSLRKELSDIESKLNSLEARKSEIENTLYANKQDKAVLCTKDKDLEEKAVAILAKLLEVPNAFIDVKEEDFRFTTASCIIAFEVKGCVKGLQGRHITKTLHHAQIIQDELEEADERKVKGVLIVATEIEKPLNEREPFPSRQLDLARINNIGIVSTESLLRLYEAYQEKRLDKEVLVQLFSTISGEITIDGAIIRHE